MLIDSHCHLRNENRDELILRARENNVTKIIAIALNKKELLEYRNSSLTNPDFYFAAGIHPHDAKEFDESIFDEIKKYKTDKNFVGVGETGLDFHYDLSPRDIQIDVFKKHILFANSLLKEGINIPLIVHTREAENETIAILDELADKNLKIIIHCFSGSLNFGKECILRNYYLSFSGIVTFKTAKEIQEVAQLAHENKILIETDSPYLAPIPMRGKENEPSYIVHTFAKICGLRNWALDIGEKILYENTKKVFFERE